LRSIVVDERMEQIAAAVGWPAAQLVELDRRPLPLLLIEGTYETVTVRDQGSGQIRDVTVEAASGNVADPRSLRRQDSDMAHTNAPALSPELRDLLLRHPELSQVRVWVTGHQESSRQPLTTSARAAARLAADPAVVRIDLAEDPVIPDED
jgi:hypothetical protein